MGKRNLLVFAVLTAAMLVAGTAFAGSDRDRVTGGGQVMNVFDPGTPDDPDDDIQQITGAGDTIAFSAQEDGSGTYKGEAQYVDRDSDASGKGTGQGQRVYHYKEITCFEVAGTPGEKGGMALITATKGTGTTAEWIQLQVFDGGPHNDQIFIERGTGAEPECETEDQEEVALARGNVTVYDAPE